MQLARNSALSSTDTTLILVLRWSTATRWLSCVGDKCRTTANAMPGLSGMASKNCRSAGMPPADAPIATSGFVFCLLRETGAAALGADFFGATFRFAFAIDCASPAACRLRLAGTIRTLTPCAALYSVIHAWSQGAVTPLNQSPGRKRRALRRDIVGGILCGEVRQFLERYRNLEELQPQRDIIRPLRVAPQLRGSPAVVRNVWCVFHCVPRSWEPLSGAPIGL